MKRKVFNNPYIGISKADFSGVLFYSESDTYANQIIEAEKKGQSLNYLRIDGDFFYDGQYYSADILVPHRHWLNSHPENRKKLWLAVVLDKHYEDIQENEPFDFNLIKDHNWGPMKTVLLSELDEQQMKEEEFKKAELIKYITSNSVIH